MSNTLSVRDLCERYAVTEHTVLGWIRTGELRAVNVGRRLARRNHAGASHRSRWRHSSSYARLHHLYHEHNGGSEHRK